MPFKPALWDGSDPFYSPCLSRSRDLFFWRAPKLYIKAGQSAAPIPLPGRLDDDQGLDRAKRCRDLTRAMVRWHENEGTNAKVALGTWMWLIGRYKTDEYSPFHNVKSNTRLSYLAQFKHWEDAIGGVEIAKTDYEAIMRWIKVMKDKNRTVDHISRMFRHLRILTSYGVMVKAVGAKDVRDILSEMKLKSPRPRTQSPTQAQIEGIIAAADKAGNKAFALGLSFQWWLTLRAVDVRGQWLKDGDTKRWADGLTWAMISKDLYTLTKVPSKTEESMPEALVWDLTPLLDLRRRLSEIPMESRIGPVIVQSNGVPFLSRRWSMLFRKFADRAGVPKEVWGMDTRAGAINHAKRSGASRLEMQHQANHADAKTTERYIRQRSDTANDVIQLRTRSQRG
jgi:hypothetical protein